MGTTIEAIAQYSHPKEGSTPLGTARESNIEIIVESYRAYDERLGSEFAAKY